MELSDGTLLVVPSIIFGGIDKKHILALALTHKRVAKISIAMRRCSRHQMLH